MAENALAYPGDVNALAGGAAGAQSSNALARPSPLSWEGMRDNLSNLYHSLAEGGLYFTPAAIPLSARDAYNAATTPQEESKLSPLNVQGNRTPDLSTLQGWKSGLSDLYQSGGDTGLALTGMFAGPRAKTADLSKMNRAAAMESAGHSPDSIWKETGWFKGADGKWKFEIPDHEAIRFGNEGVQESRGDHNKISNSRTYVGTNAPETYPRPFTSDYKHSTIADGSSLTTTIDGEPLTAPYVAGRRVAGGADEPILPSEYGALSKALFSSEPIPRPAKEIGYDAGRYNSNVDPGWQADQAALRGSGGVGERARYIEYNSALTPRQKEIVVPHEIGHGIDDLAGQIPTKGIADELGAIYHTLYTGSPYGKRIKPQDLGYKGADIQREQMAEAIRAYLTDPNYIKTAAPKTAEVIRKAVNTNLALSRTIQFNSLLAPLAIGTLGTSAMLGSSNNQQLIDPARSNDGVQESRNAIGGQSIDPARRAEIQKWLKDQGIK